MGKRFISPLAEKVEREGTDIWQSDKNSDGTWGIPKPVSFNTAGSDFTPHIHADGQTMYFSSDGRPGMGGHDIYFVRKQPNGKLGGGKKTLAIQLILNWMNLD